MKKNSPLLILLSTLFFIIDVTWYYFTYYQITYTVLLFFIFLIAKENSRWYLFYLLCLLALQQCFFYGHPEIVLLYIPITYIVIYKMHNSLYFNTSLFITLCILYLGIQVIIVEKFLIHIAFLHYSFTKICSNLCVMIWLGYYIRVKPIKHRRK
jgi:hypothetical protein